MARANPKKSRFSGPTPSNAPRYDVALLKTISYRAIKTTGTLIVNRLFCSNDVQEFGLRTLYHKKTDLFPPQGGVETGFGAATGEGDNHLQRVRVLWCGQDHSDRYAVYDSDLPDCAGSEPTAKLLRGKWLLLRYKLLRVHVKICRMNTCLSI